MESLDAAVTSLPWLYPSAYFKGSEVLIADGQHSVQPIASVWPQLPKATSSVSRARLR